MSSCIRKGRFELANNEPGLRAALGPQPLLNTKFRVHFRQRDTEGFGYQYPFSTHTRVRLSSGSTAAAADAISGKQNVDKAARNDILYPRFR
jgi:hypothetical protein